jgi:hypothetical protein
MKRILAGILLGLCVPLSVACDSSHGERRINTDLGSDGYALFRAHAPGGYRLALLVEIRSAPQGTYALLHSRNPPQSVGWFDLDVEQFAACKRYGEAANTPTALGCVLPDGHGDLVDVVEVGATERPDALLRHELVPIPLPAPTSRSSSSASSHSSSTPVPPTDGYYAVMRIERDGQAVPIAVEVRTMDSGYNVPSPSVERID